MAASLGADYAKRRFANRYGNYRQILKLIVTLILFTFVSAKLSSYFFSNISASAVITILFYIFSAAVLYAKSISQIRNPSEPDFLFPLGLNQNLRQSIVLHIFFSEISLLFSLSTAALIILFIFFGTDIKTSLFCVIAALSFSTIILLSMKLCIRYDILKPKKYAYTKKREEYQPEVPSFLFLDSFFNHLKPISSLSSRTLAATSLKSVFRKNSSYFALIIALPPILSIALFSAPLSFFPVYMTVSAIAAIEIISYTHEANLKMFTWTCIVPASEKQHRQARTIVNFISAAPYLVIGVTYAIIKGMLFNSIFWHSLGVFLSFIAISSFYNATFRKNPFVASLWNVILLIVLGITFFHTFLALPIFLTGLLFISLQIRYLKMGI
ncbi:MAG: hypothetical protein JNL74_18500 [Fibrobacteres bacterium]|nr:hypothetical protein [Fibrobacterota bacterium]